MLIYRLYGSYKLPFKFDVYKVYVERRNIGKLHLEGGIDISKYKVSLDYFNNLIKK
jgi:hypothetical protein